MSLPFHDETMRCRQAQRTWTQRPIRERLRCVRRLRHLLVDAADQLALAVTQDVGRAAGEVLTTDIVPTADACRFLERQAGKLLRPRRVPLLQRPLWLVGTRDTVLRRPHGIVGIIGTWNYPIFLNAVQIVQALAAGNGVLWKPSELTPSLAPRLHRLFLEAGFPPDLFILLPATREAGPDLAEAAIDHIVFTGSADVGRKLARRLGERLVSSTLELSGCDALIVAADADLKMAAKAAWWGMTLNGGQTCLAIRRIFVEQSVCPAFQEELRSLSVKRFPQPLQLDQQAQQADRLVQDALGHGANLLHAGQPSHAQTDPPRFPPTIVVDATPAMALGREAAFAPIAEVLPFEHFEEVVQAQEVCPFALGTSIFTRDRAQALAWAEKLHAGSICINDVIAPTAHPATPFGGRGDSGWGVTQGAEGLLEMTVPQVLSVRGGSFRPHYETSEAGRSVTTDLMKGMLSWRHAGRWRQRWSGFWKMVRAGMRFTSINKEEKEPRS